MQCALNHILERGSAGFLWTYGPVFVHESAWVWIDKNETVFLQIKQHNQGTSRLDMKLDFNNSFYFMQWEASKETKPWEKEMAPLIMNQVSQLPATLRKIFQMFADVAIFLAVFMWRREEPVRLRVVKTQLCLHQAGPNHTRRGS